MVYGRVVIEMRKIVVRATPADHLLHRLLEK
jgi:hypothetical protein